MDCECRCLACHEDNCNNISKCDCVLHDECRCRELTVKERLENDKYVERYLNGEFAKEENDVVSLSFFEEIKHLSKQERIKRLREERKRINRL